MRPDHAYMFTQLKTYLDLSKRMDDRLLQYLLAMACDHCLEQIKGHIKHQD